MTTFSLYFFLAVIVSAVHILFEYKNIQNQIHTDLRSISLSTTDSLASSMWGLDSIQLENVIDGLLTLQFITGVEIHGDIKSLNISRGNINTNTSLQYQHPITYIHGADVRPLGFITLYSEQAIVFDRMKVNVVFIVMNAFIKTFFLSIIMLYIGSRIICRPLGELLHSVHRLDLDSLKSIEQSKIMSSGQESDKANELTELICAYNKTLDQLLVRTQQRDDAKEQLESKNRCLEKLVDEKTLALQDKLDELNTMNENLKALASTDYLTELFNRRAFFDRADDELSRLRRERKKACILIVDIDHFKAVNDQYGHPAGDALLVAVSKILKHNIRQHDLVARYGGEEFAILLVDIEMDEAILLAERMRENIAKQKVIFKGDVIKATASFGLAMMFPESKDIDSVLSNADKLLYKAKASGRNLLKY
ncbi:hypothetical protein AB835_08375 [Candidatus Endobugula sertula]|uniref:diguanylate cyclase n=1 Tax=Candidatus Endobugula sertula TaxID=62101 RepID=A0A1D2QPJ2_9GAMM|nr:hypothetical protein AB835_08375 [Candidatus Endobugula sertula]